ncbi:MAG: ZinT/AdcA family metal-binding protein, partial [Eubacteriales bacterium]|nr:ZinT/AdcA family metal-binding protein [Eubacteriales bacterium]
MKIKRIFALLMALSLLVFFAGCETKEVLNEEKPTEVDVENDVEDEESDEISIADWEGEWNSLGAYLEDEGLQDTFAHMAEEHGESVEEVKAEIAEDYGLPFGAMKIEGKQVTFIDGKAEDGKEIETVSYNFVKSHEMSHGGHSFFWHIFEAEGDASYKILFMMPVHGEESVAHLHMRFGDDIAELLAKEEWYPTFVKPSTTTEQLAEVFAHHDHD